MNERIRPGFGPATRIQSQGWMLVCDRNGVFVRRRSANADDIFPAVKGGDVVNLADAVGAEAAHVLRNAMARAAGSCSVLVPRLCAGGALLDAIVHLTQDEIIIEFEPAGRDSPASPLDMARLMLERLPSLDAAEKPKDLHEFLYSAARLLGACLHFDRVTIAPTENGPESLRVDYSLDNEPFGSAAMAESALRGLMAEYVADFGLLRQSRTIHDIEAAANALLSTESLNGASLDLSRAMLRGVSTAERKYLRELGASACLLLPITVDGALWGLVACLNRAAGLPSLESRAIAELVARFLSLHVRIALPPRGIRAGFLAEAPIASPPSAKAACRRTRKGRRAKNHDLSRMIC
jgi:light-regulated signal transduction histidine kinase (bacteriophytochrome)